MNENQIDNEKNIDQTNNENIDQTLEEKRAEVAKLNAIIDRKTNKVKEVNEAKEEKEESPIINNQVNADYERLSLKVDYGYPDAIIDSIIKYGGKEALKDPVIKRAVDELHQEHKNEIASNIDTGSKSDWEKKYTQKDLANMSADELEKILPHAQN